jgi:flavin-binding protein dodecin
MLVVSAKDLERAFKELEKIPGAAPKAISAAINKGVDKAHDSIISHVTAVYNLRPHLVEEYLKKYKSNRGNLAGSVVSEAPHMPWREFGLGPLNWFVNRMGNPAVTNYPYPVHVRIRRSRTFPHSIFIAKHTEEDWFNAYIRGDEKRRLQSTQYPIRNMMTIGVSEMMTSKAALPGIKKDVYDTTTQELTKQINSFLNKHD